MTTTRRTIRSEEFVNFPNNPNAEDHPTAPGLSPGSATATTVNGSDPSLGGSWTISNGTSISDMSATAGAGGSYSSYANSRRLEYEITFDNYLKDDPVYGVPASRCRVDINLGVSAVGSVQNLGFGMAVTANGGALAPADSGEGGERVSSGASSNTNFNIYRSDVGNIKQSGSDVTMEAAGKDQRKIKFDYLFNTYSVHPQNINYGAEIRTTFAYGGPLSRFWEADLHVIDDLDGDSVTFTSPTITLTETTSVLLFQDRVQAFSSTTSLSEDSINSKFATMTASSTSSIAITPSFIIGPTKQLDSVATLDATTENFVRADSLALDSTTTLTATPTMLLGLPATDYTAAAGFTGTGGLIYDIAGDYTWDNVADIATGEQYTWDETDQGWDFWEDDLWGIEPDQWDNWDLNLWARPFNLITRASTTETLTFKPAGFSTQTATFTFAEDTALNEAAEASLSSAFTISPTAAGIVDITITLSGAFSPTLSDTVIFDQPSVVSITGAFTPVLTANATFSGETALLTSVAFDITPTLRVGPYQEVFSAVFTQADTVPSLRVGPYQLVLNAFASKLTTAKLFYQADPFNIITVPAETRVAVLPAETRISTIDQENRVNKVTADTRTYLVDQETRRFKLRVAPISNRFSTPKQRAEA